MYLILEMRVRGRRFNNNKMDISKLSIESLKALKCDIYEKLSLGQRDLQIINARLVELNKETEKEVKVNKK